MVIATFSPNSALSGKSITYEDGRFALEGSLALDSKQVLEFDERGELEWAYGGLREWARDLANTASDIPSQAVPPTDAYPRPMPTHRQASTSPGDAVASSSPGPTSRRKLVWITVSVAAAILIVIVVVPLFSSAGRDNGTPAPSTSPGLVASSSPTVSLAGFTTAENRYWADTHADYREVVALTQEINPLLPKWQSLTEAKRDVVRSDVQKIGRYYGIWRGKLLPNSRWKRAHALWTSWLRDLADGMAGGVRGLELSLTEGASQHVQDLVAKAQPILKRTDRTQTQLLAEWSRLKKRSAVIDALSAYSSSTADNSASTTGSSAAAQPALAERVAAALHVRTDYTSFDIPTPTVKVTGPAYGGGKVVSITYYVPGGDIFNENAFVDGVSPATVDVMAGAFSEPEVKIVDVIWKTDFADPYGESSKEAAFEIRWKRKTFKKVNVEGLVSRCASSPEDLYMMSDWYSIHPAIWKATHLKDQIPMIP
jgi:hypothetical protein